MRAILKMQVGGVASNIGPVHTEASGIVPDLAVEQEMPADSKGNAPAAEASLPNHFGPARSTRE